MNAIFRDRREAGRRLAESMLNLRGTPRLLVLALPRGGVPVGWEVARALGAELDLLVVRKLGFPGQPELAMGAIASGGEPYLNEDLVRGISDEQLAAVIRAEKLELERRERKYRGDRPPIDVGGRTVILVDDGLATGATMQAAIQLIRKREAERILVAVPVAPAESVLELGQIADEVICLNSPEHFRAVGQWYLDFSQTTDMEVVELLHRSTQLVQASRASASSA